MQLSVKDLIMNIGADSQVKPSQAKPGKPHTNFLK